MKLLLVDVSHVFWSSYFASAGDSPDAPYQVTLERISRLGDGFDIRIACCDVGASFRKKLLPEYKANRPERDAAAYHQLDRVKEQLQADGWPCIGVPEYEADDVIATLCVKAPPEFDQIVIASGDKDLSQLIGGRIIVQSTNPNGGIVDEAKVREKYGVGPDRIVDFLALTGDTSDNVKGCPGIGPVHAARLLAETGSLDNMLLVPDSITPASLREKFLANRDGVQLARKLVTLTKDVPIDWAEAIKVPPKPEKRQTVEAPAEEDESVPDAAAGTPTPAMDMVYGKVGEKPADAGTEQKPIAATSTAIVPAQSFEIVDRGDPRYTLGLEPRSAKMLQWYCHQLHASGLYRKFQSSEAIMSVVLRGRALGLDMTTSLDVFNVIKGKPTMGAMAIIGRCLASSKCEFFDCIADSETEATWETQRKGRPPRKMTYTIKEAERVGLLRPSEKGEDSNWVKRPKEMLRKQSGVILARTVYPDIVANMYDPDEMDPYRS